MIERIMDNAKRFFKEDLFEISTTEKLNINPSLQLITICEPQNSTCVDIYYDSNIIFLDPENKFFNKIFEILNLRKDNKNNNSHEKGDAILIWNGHDKAYVGIFELKTTLGVRTFKKALRQIQNTMLGTLLILRFLRIDLIEYYYGIILYKTIKITDTDPVEYDPYINPHDVLLDQFLKRVCEIFKNARKVHKGIEFPIKSPESNETMLVKLFRYDETPLYLDTKGIFSSISKDKNP
ncbi:hypothetical protein [Thermococcus aciditolerans]|uniref:Uncharacterized protein n=1 Tax=Thermococcus aciditolerans TaxID=2598455 RepID=A0A5C0SKV8_9EURY|nr:hypothetical protein [Thermococcus aciditolerans]QEK14662.1 hypothetical protein FPV09_05640 [Thermococcus aciditolerans]